MFDSRTPFKELRILIMLFFNKEMKFTVNIIILIFNNLSNQHCLKMKIRRF